MGIALSQSNTQHAARQRSAASTYLSVSAVRPRRSGEPGAGGRADQPHHASAEPCGPTVGLADLLWLMVQHESGEKKTVNLELRGFDK